ncbi:hypothetical protein HDU93_005701 [Gonapodya sp. JEL0774]|nr:hypothetical protein HDU93_005701 [Gonapodya sp. JEL0774]
MDDQEDTELDGTSKQQQDGHDGSQSSSGGWRPSQSPKDFRHPTDRIEFLDNLSATDGTFMSFHDERQSLGSLPGSPPELEAVDATDTEDPLTRVIRLRNQTTYFGPAVKARRRGADKSREIIFDIEDNLAKLAAQATSTVPRANAVFVTESTGAGVDMDTVLAMMEKMKMNPEPVNMRMMHNLVPAEPPRLDLLAQFFDVFWFPAIHPGTFFHTLQHQSPLLLCAIYAFSTCISHGAPGSPEWSEERQTGEDAPVHPGELYFTRARRLLTIAFDEPSLSTAFALLLMSMYSAGAGRASSGWMYSGMAVRMLVEMKWRVGDTSQLTPLEHEIRKRVWWFCFIFSTSTSICADRPTFVEPADGMMSYPDDDVWNSLNDTGEVGFRHQNEGPILLRQRVAGGITHPNPPTPPIGTNTLQQLAHSKYFREISEAWVLLQQVYKYAKDQKVQRTAIGVVDPHLSLLDRQVKSLWAQLPEMAQGEFVPPNPASLADLKELASSACLHITLHCCTIKLHRCVQR